MHAAEHQLARAERQNGRDDRVERARRRCARRGGRRRGRATSASDTPTAAIDHADRRFDQHVPAVRQEPGRQEMPVEPALIRERRRTPGARRRAMRRRSRSTPRRDRRTGPRSTSAGSSYDTVITFARASRRMTSVRRQSEIIASRAGVCLQRRDGSARRRASTGCCGRFTGGCGAISIAACASCSPSPRSKAMADATSCAPPKSRRIRSCAGSTWNTRSTSCATPICFVERGAALLQLRATRVHDAVQHEPPPRRPRPRRPVHRRTNPTIVCSPFCTWRRRRRPAVSRSIAMSSTTIRRRARSSKRSSAMKCST